MTDRKHYKRSHVTVTHFNSTVTVRRADRRSVPLSNKIVQSRRIGIYV